MPRLAHRFTSFPAYPLAHIPARKKALIDAGVDVIDLGAGDADLAPPPAAVLALQQAAEVPAMQRYGFGLGLVRYREAVAAWMHIRSHHKRQHTLQPSQKGNERSFMA
jgi:LL-diaminopimelate aminotransferase